MNLQKEKYENYLQILKAELIPAMGCTEPIAIAYASAKAREVLGSMPEQVEITVSRNIIKNVKSVVVPNTGGLRGIEAAAVAGIVAGEANQELEVIAGATESQIAAMHIFLGEIPVKVECAKTPYLFDIEVTLKAKELKSVVRILDSHTNIVKIEKDDQVLFEKEAKAKQLNTFLQYELLTVEDIFLFANEVPLQEVEPVIERQILYNMAIAKEGLANPYGANIGKVLLKTYGDSVAVRAKAKAAAGSDARMNGCEMPVVINSGSGNQGITTSVPVIEYAEELGVSKEVKIRALVLSNLLTIHMKTGVGKLSAYCGAVIAGCASGAGIAYLHGGDYRVIAHTLVNSLAIVSGIICDGAKASCAAKIVSAVDAGILGFHMFMEGQQFVDGDGIVKKGVQNTIQNVGKLASVGMVETDKEIINIMMN